VIYTSDTNGAFTLGGLAGYTQVDGVAFPSDPNGTVMLVLYRAAGGDPEPEPELIPMTITANDFIRRYGEPDPGFTASFSGGTSGNLTAQPQFAIAEGAHVNVGTYTIVPFGAASNTHELDYENGTLRIDPVLLTYVAGRATRVYGDANSAFSGTVTGFVNGDTLASATSGTLAFGSTATAASNAGTHAILGSGLTANHGNYVFEQASGNFSAFRINPAPLTIAADAASRVYGDANPAFTATFSGFKNGDTASALTGLGAGTTATTASPVGSYPIVFSSVTTPNYAITYVPSTLTVTKAPLTVQVADASRTYGDANPAFSATFSGFKNGETAGVLSGLTLGTTATAASEVGAYPILASGATATNYDIAYRPGTLAVNKAPLTATVANASRTYGVVNPAFALVSVTGLKNGEDANVIANLAFNSVGPGAAVGSHAIAATGTAANYDLQFMPGTLTIQRAPLTLWGTDVLSQWGDTPPALGYTITGLVNDDPPSVLTGVTFDRSFSAATAPGTYLYQFSSLGRADNYIVTSWNAGALLVAPRPMTVTAQDVESVVGAVPPLTAISGFAPLAGGPQFTLGVRAWTDSRNDDGTTQTVPLALTARTPAGSYRLRVDIVPAADTTLAAVQRHYQFNFVEGTLQLKASQADLTNVTVTNVMPDDGTLVVTGPFGPTPEIKLDKNLFIVPELNVKVGWDKNAAVNPQMLAELGALLRPVARDLVREYAISGDGEGRDPMLDVLAESEYDYLDRLDNLANQSGVFDQIMRDLPTSALARTALSVLIVQNSVSASKSGRQVPASFARILNGVAARWNADRAQKLAAAAEKLNTANSPAVAFGAMGPGKPGGFEDPFGVKAAMDVPVAGAGLQGLDLSDQATLAQVLEFTRQVVAGAHQAPNT
jgi:hypothetical protein